MGESREAFFSNGRLKTMATMTLEERVSDLENRVRELETWRGFVKATAERTLEKLQAFVKK